jgi:hypothetical protein
VELTKEQLLLIDRIGTSLTVMPLQGRSPAFDASSGWLHLQRIPRQLSHRGHRAHGGIVLCLGGLCGPCGSIDLRVAIVYVLSPNTRTGWSLW